MILFITDVTKPDYYKILLDHLHIYYPSQKYVVMSVELSDAPLTIEEPNTIVWFLQDPLINRPAIFRKAESLYETLKGRFPSARHINRPYGLPNMAKTVTLALARTINKDYAPQSRVIYHPDQRAKFLQERKPGWFVREDFYHGHNMVLFEKESDYDDVVKLSHVHEMHNAAAIEYCDCYNPTNKRYWKYRCMVIKERVYPVHLQCGKNWVVHGNDRIQDDKSNFLEADYLRYPVPYREFFVKLANWCNVDWCVFDYGFDKTGLKVFECSTFPFLHYISHERQEHHTIRNQATKDIINKLIQFFIGKDEQNAS